VRPEDKKFTVNGAITLTEASRYFFVKPDIAPLVKQMENRTMFMLYGPRGGGKTTAALHALEEVRSRGWVPLKVDFSSVTLVDRQAFWRGLGGDLGIAARRHGIELQFIDSPETFRAAFSTLHLGSTRVILMLDEFDVLGNAAPGIKEEVRGRANRFRRGGLPHSISAAVCEPFGEATMRIPIS
jgi:hypothetical protein